PPAGTIVALTSTASAASSRSQAGPHRANVGFLALVATKLSATRDEVHVPHEDRGGSVGSGRPIVGGDGRTESLVDAGGVKHVLPWHDPVHHPRTLPDARRPPVAMAGEAPIDCRIVEARSVVQRPEEAREHRPVGRRPPARGAPRVYVVDIV